MYIPEKNRNPSGKCSSTKGSKLSAKMVWYRAEFIIPVNTQILVFPA